MTAGTEYVIDIYGVYNPGNDGVTTGIWVKGGQTVAGNRSYTNFWYEDRNLYTQNIAQTTEGNQVLPNISPTDIQTTTSFDLQVATGSVVQLDEHFDHIRLVYNTDMRNTAIDATDFEPFDVEDGLAYFYSETTK